MSHAVFAGMPSITLTDAASMRLQTLSFFLLAFLVTAFAIRWIWNAFRSDFPRLPRLSYPKAVGLVGLWGLLFLLVLTMISGARELMTPGAWKKDGVTYTLAEPPKPADAPAAGPSDDVRRAKLAALYTALAGFAATHGGAFPPADDPAVPADAWKSPHASGLRYVYAPGRTVRDAGRRLAHEPDLFDGGRFVLFADGAVKKLSSGQLAASLAAEGK